MKDIDKNEFLIENYEVYGKLLTLKQQEYFELYFFNDYSLGEIALKFNISRSAIYDTLLKIEKRLNYFEQILQIIANSKKRQTLLKQFQKEKNSNMQELIVQLLELEDEHKGDE